MTLKDLKEFIAENEIPDTTILRVLHPETMEYVDVTDIECFCSPLHSFCSIDFSIEDEDND